jgi:glycosyltransferase involved in cell wall biosynthesis
VQILIVVHGFPPWQSGGSELRAERTARGLLERGYQVSVLTRGPASSSGGAGAEDLVQQGLRIRRLLLPDYPAGQVARGEFDDARVGAAVEQLIEARRPTLVHQFSGYRTSSSVVAAAVARRVPVVVSLTDFWWLCHRVVLIRSDGARCSGPTPPDCARCQAEWSRRFRLPARRWPAGARLFWRAAGQQRLVGRWLGVERQRERAALLLERLRQADALIAPSRFLAQTYARSGLDGARIQVWRQGVELPAGFARRPAPELRVGYAGQIKPHKGVHTLLAAWPLLRGSQPRRLKLYGSSSGEPAYGAAVRRGVGRLAGASWAGQFRPEQRWDVLADLDVLVVPSRWPENSPNIILEAQAAGLPVVGANLGGIPELVEHGCNGLLFEPDDAADLAGQLQRLLDEPDLLADLRQQARPVRTMAEEHDELVGLYQRLGRPPAER